jgi:hypothetical protein
MDNLLNLVETNGIKLGANLDHGKVTMVQCLNEKELAVGFNFTKTVYYQVDGWGNLVEL